MDKRIAFFETINLVIDNLVTASPSLPQLIHQNNYLHHRKLSN
ncbi:hypothetical protein GXM_09032 [Nostoc sphaeroides CCNUC1]|uniref:Uncharacterized protein n=1 Tax=Nostoc sphaeroides CCNUC1 TaxID=2653204 RepID=A0A5P8WFI4_9NOSO|nr:hypothetical protein GXM_09032 [Nostoc sphaeroides CCNUC1]